MQLKSFKKPKDFNNARQESLTRFDQPKKKKKTNKNQSQQWKTDRLAKIKLSQTTKKPANTTPSGASEKRTCNNKKTNNYY
jgi:hypothetical protein